MRRRPALTLGPRPLVAALALVAALSLASGCSPATPPLTGRPSDALMVDAAALSKRDPRTAQRIAKSPFAYFRYTNRPFVDLVCERYAGALAGMPLVHAHGDAHLEQYAVAEEARGLADFDASAAGPPVVDLVRFATSLVLAAPREDSARSAIEALLRGYLRALEDPTASVPEPAAAARIRSRFASTKVEWLDRVEKLMVPIPPKELPSYMDGWADFAGQMRARDPSIDSGFFKIKVGGHLDGGIGSAHAEKILVRVEGPTPAPEDDLVLEAKAVEAGSLGSCMRGVDLDATRVIKGQAQISNAPQRFLAAVRIDGKPFYSHAWLVHYTELTLADIQSASELAEIAEDVGLQLGRGHAKREDVSRVPEQRRALKAAAETFGPGIADIAIDLARRVIGAWASYRAQLRRP